MRLERMKFAEPGNFDTALAGMVLGAQWDKESSPVLIRTDGAVGLIAQAGVDDGVVLNDFDQMPIFGEIRDVTDHLGNEYVRIPKFYIRKVDEPGLKTWQISKTQREGYYLPACFYDCELDTELPYIDVGKYNASLSDAGLLESQPDTYPLISRTIVNFRTYARANNAGGLRGYQQMDIHVVDLLQTLFYIEFATLNSQAIMQGFTTGQYSDSHTAVISEANTNRVVLANAYAASYRVGQAISVGTARGNTSVFYGRTIVAIEDYDGANKAIVFDGGPVDIAEGNVVWNSGWKSGFSSGIAASSGSIGSNTDGKYPCCYRGIENPWGSVYEFVDGVNITDHQAWTCKDAAQYASNVFASPYEQLSYVNHDANGYPAEMGHDPARPFAEFPIAIQTSGISSSKYYSDYYYQAAGQRVALVGGGWIYGAAAGLSFWNLNRSSGDADVYIGGRLVKKPL
jgi:hypothetical protein